MKRLTSPLIPLTFLEEYSLDESTIHAMHSVRTKQGFTIMLKNLMILACLLLLWFFSDAVLANSPHISESGPDNNDTPFSSMWFESHDGEQKIASEALSTHISMMVSGPILRAKIKQTFRNTSQYWLEGVYTFPLPEQAAVDQLRMVIGERIVLGEIKEKAAAKQAYENARKNGQRASLLKHHRTNIFTSSVANIGPNEDISVEFEYQQVLDFRDHQYHLRFPMVSTPQYTPPQSRANKEFIEPITNIRPSGTHPSNPITIEVHLEPGFPIELPTSISHPITVHAISGNSMEKEQYNISLKGSAALSNRDFILSWKLKPSSKPMVSILREDKQGESYGLMMVMPPQAPMNETQLVPRELIWVLDVSGSMQGESIEQARSAILKALSKLSPNDYFNIICFNDRAWKLFPQSRSGNMDNLNLARGKILNLEANGGTNMRPALSLALGQHFRSERLRQIIFVTDGAVSNEAALSAYIESELGNARLFTVGIGSAPNSYFMRKAALAGRGSFTYISHPSEVSAKIDHLLRKLESPALTDLGFNLNNPQASVLPNTLPDVYMGEPVYIAFKADNFPNYAELSGYLNGTPSRIQLPLPQPQEGNELASKGVAVEWARRKLAELVDRYHKADGERKTALREEALDIALAHHQVSPFTSLVAVDKPAERAGGLLKRQDIPANAPKGWVNQPSSTSIRFAQTATNLPFQLWFGSSLVCLSLLLWLAQFLLTRRIQA